MSESSQLTSQQASQQASPQATQQSSTKQSSEQPSQGLQQPLPPGSPQTTQCSAQTQRLLDEIRQFRKRYPDVAEVDLIALDIPGNFFGKRYPITQLEKSVETGLKLPASIPLMCVQGYPVNALGYGLDDGDPDTTMYLIPGSLQPVRWETEPRAQMFCTTGIGPAPLAWEPRVILQQVLNQFQTLDLYPTVAYELEFYLVSMERDSDGLIQPPRDPVTGNNDRTAVLAIDRLSDYGDCLREIILNCQQQGIKTGPISAELGPGQYEINLDHHSDVMLAADQCACFRRIVKGVARKQGYLATFMAKPYLDHPGNGLHLHVSLYDKNGNNALDKHNKTNLLHAVAGCLELLPASMAMFAANRNAYRRLQPNNFTAVSPNWGYENRFVAVRIPNSDAANTRLEHRVSGADANPYLTLAAILAGILHGLVEKADPGAPCDGSTDQTLGLPTDLNQALSLMRQSNPLRKLLGDKFVDVYCAQKYSELVEFENLISAREYDWYL